MSHEEVLQANLNWVLSKFQACGRGITKNLKNLYHGIGKFSKQFWRGQKQEEQKVVLRKDFQRAVLQCWAHFLALLGTVTIAYLNLAGYFIGAQLQGRTGKKSQALDMLCLQVTAKFLELLIVASLGIICMDVLRSQLLFGCDGLPLGLVSSKQRFPEVQYITSPEFRFGLAGFPSRRKRILFVLLIVTFTVVSLLAGPAAATLIIPTQRHDWAAGGASLWLAGDEESLWPSRLRGSSIGGPQCQSPDVSTLTNTPLNHSGCNWAGYMPLSEAFKQTHLKMPQKLPINNGIVNQIFVIYYAWADFLTASHMASGAYAKNAAQLWYQAMVDSPASSRYYSIRYRDRDATTGLFRSWAPAVGTRCHITDPVFYNDSGLMGRYPGLPEFGAPLLEDYGIKPSFSRSPQISAQWIRVPKTIPLSNGSITTDVPSAFLSVMIPHDISNTTGGTSITTANTANKTGNTSNTTGTVFTCSVDARWAMANYRGEPIQTDPNLYTLSAVLEHLQPQPGDTSWRRVQIDRDWLENLTPPLNESKSGWNTLAASLTDIGMENITAIVVDPDAMSLTLESVTSSFVADGMSRQGYSANGGSMSNASGELSLLPWDGSTSSRDSILSGTYSSPRPGGPATRLKWSVIVSGYAYLADSTAYYLALTVLFVHAALALGHTAYVLKTRVFCDAWDSFVNIIVLAATSGLAVGDSNLFKNTGGGIDGYRTMSTNVRIRASSLPPPPSSSKGIDVDAATTKEGEEHVKILFGNEEPDTVRYRRLERGKAYG